MIIESIGRVDQIDGSASAFVSASTSLLAANLGKQTDREIRKRERRGTINVFYRFMAKNTVVALDRTGVALFVVGSTGACVAAARC